MSFSYNATLATTRDRVRFELGDTNENQVLLQNEEIDALLASDSDPIRVSILGAEAIAAKFAREADLREGPLAVSASQIADSYEKLANRLRLRTARSVEIHVGGRSLDKKKDAGDDEDRVQPAFSRGMDDFPGTSLDGTVNEFDD